MEAHVHCDCFEHERLRTPAPAPRDALAVDDDGKPCAREDAGLEAAVAAWRDASPCEHSQLRIATVRFGPAPSLASPREFLSGAPAVFPLVLEHALGASETARIPADELHELRREIATARAHLDDLSDEDAVAAIASFLERLEVLLEAGEKTGKPVVFVRGGTPKS